MVLSQSQSFLWQQILTICITFLFSILIPYRRLCPHFILKPVLDIYRTANNFPFMYFQKRFSQASLLISTKYFQKRITKFCLELWYSGENYSTIDSAIQMSAQGTTYTISNEITVVQDIHISILDCTELASWNYFLFWSIYLVFGIEVWLIPFGIM